MRNKPSSRPAAQRILGIDPGLAKVGWGVIEEQNGMLRRVASGVIRTSNNLPHGERLKAIFVGLRELIATHEPRVAAIEEVFQGKNVRSALLAGEGRAVCILAAGLEGLVVHEYPATIVKVAVTGNGRAAKVQVQAMVDRLLGPARDRSSWDASDALAIALTHLQRSALIAVANAAHR